MVVSVASKYYEKAAISQKDQQVLAELQECAPEHIYEKYRQLSPSSLCLTAARSNHYGLLKTKLKMFSDFDQELKKASPESLSQSHQIFQLAAKDLSKIVSLRHLYAVLMDPEKRRQEKIDAYKEIGSTNEQFFREIKHCIWVAHGGDLSAGWDFGDRMIEQEPDHRLYKGVIKAMIKRLKEHSTDFTETARLFCRPEQLKQNILDSESKRQSKIVSLERLHAILINPEKSKQEKIDAYKEIKSTNEMFFCEIKNCIWVAHGGDLSAGWDFGDRMIEEEPDHRLYKSIIREMIIQLKNHHTNFIERAHLFCQQELLEQEIEHSEQGCPPHFEVAREVIYRPYPVCGLL